MLSNVSCLVLKKFCAPRNCKLQFTLATIQQVCVGIILSHLVHVHIQCRPGFSASLDLTKGLGGGVRSGLFLEICNAQKGQLHGIGIVLLCDNNKETEMNKRLCITLLQALTVNFYLVVLI